MKRVMWAIFTVILAIIPVWSCFGMGGGEQKPAEIAPQWAPPERKSPSFLGTIVDKRSRFRW